MKALLNYPDVVKTMSGDLDWTSALGEAVVADQGAVLEAIQAFRRKAQAAGNLKSDDKQVVVVEKEIIKIVPANPEVIYVPQYNPTTVVVAGGAAWGYYPTPYPVYYYPYPPGAAFATGLIWGAAIGAAWNGGRWNTNWGGATSTSIAIQHQRREPAGGGEHRPARGGSTAWKSDKQPGQVSNTVGRTAPTLARGRCRPAAAARAPAARRTRRRGSGSAGARAARGGTRRLAGAAQRPARQRARRATASAVGASRGGASAAAHSAATDRAARRRWTARAARPAAARCRGGASGRRPAAAAAARRRWRRRRGGGGRR